jgi:hypothetical protein
MKMKKQSWMNMMNEQISSIVEEKIQSMMPCLINQVHNCSADGLKKI